MKDKNTNELLRFCSNEQLLLLSVYGQDDLRDAVSAELRCRAETDTPELQYDMQIKSGDYSEAEVETVCV
jgi:hypothetical protein